MESKKNNGVFVISLDFELFWGIRDVVHDNRYDKNIAGARVVIPKMLELFSEYRIHTTWATVGFLFFNDKQILKEALPVKLPTYTNKQLSNYNYMDHVGMNEEEDPFHYAYSLIEQVAQSNHQEIATHTFSHYYCLEEGQTLDQFESDLHSAKKSIEKLETSMKSLVFARNQYNEAYLDVVKTSGITSFRGNQSVWMYQPDLTGKGKKLKKMLRLIDSYINISGFNAHSQQETKNTKPYNITASRFLRPFSIKLSFLESLRLRRIKREMLHAAKHGLVYHLWWHPHNFGVRQEENLAFLKEIFEYFLFLQKTYDFDSLTMSELSEKLEIL